MPRALRMLSLFCAFAASLVFASANTGAFAANAVKEHKIVIQVSGEDPGAMTVALGNAMNAKKYYDEKGEKLTVEIVTYGPGITMLRSDTSPVKDRIQEAKMSIPNLTLSMCANSRAATERREGKALVPIDGVQMVPAGIVRVVELQEMGYAYARP